MADIEKLKLRKLSATSESLPKKEGLENTISLSLKILVVFGRALMTQKIKIGTIQESLRMIRILSGISTNQLGKYTVMQWLI